MGNSNSSPPQQSQQQQQPQQKQFQLPAVQSPESSKCVFHPELYQGKWYEIARYTNPYEKECVRAEQRLKWDAKNQKMYITNSCIDKSGNKIKINGVGTPNKNHICQLTVVFEGVPKPGQYWIIWTDYDKWSLVGNENKTAFWMLSREPFISKDDYRLLKVYSMYFGYNGDLIVPRNAIVGYKIENDKEESVGESIDESCTDFNSDIRT